MIFEEWWQKWWRENAIAATDTEEVWKGIAEAAWEASAANCIGQMSQYLGKLHQQSKK